MGTRLLKKQWLDKARERIIQNQKHLQSLSCSFQVFYISVKIKLKF